MESLWQPISAIAAGIPCLLLGHRFLRVWRNPDSVEGGRWVKLGINVLLLEFITIHAGALMAAAAHRSDLREKILWIAGLLLLYGFVAAGLAYTSKSRQLFTMFLTVMVGRLVALLWTTGSGATDFLLYQSFISLGLYLLLALLPIPFPALGLADPKWADELRKDGSGGEWIDKPHRPIGMATVYFFALGAAEILVLSWLPLRK